VGSEGYGWLRLITIHALIDGLAGDCGCENRITLGAGQDF